MRWCDIWKVAADAAAMATAARTANFIVSFAVVQKMHFLEERCDMTPAQFLRSFFVANLIIISQSRGLGTTP
jgi:hypothetical protein